MYLQAETEAPYKTTRNQTAGKMDNVRQDLASTSYNLKPALAKDLKAVKESEPKQDNHTGENCRKHPRLFVPFEVAQSLSEESPDMT